MIKMSELRQRSNKTRHFWSAMSAEAKMVDVGFGMDLGI